MYSYLWDVMIYVVLVCISKDWVYIILVVGKMRISQNITLGEREVLATLYFTNKKFCKIFSSLNKLIKIY